MTTPLQPVIGKGRRGTLYESGRANRERLLAVIRNTPGLSFRGVCRATGLPLGTTTHHLRMLRGHGLVVAFQQGCSQRFFPADWTPEAAADQVAHSDPAQRRVLEALGAERLAQKAVLARLPGLPRSTTQHVLRRLVDLGTLRAQRQGRLVFYEVA